MKILCPGCSKEIEFELEIKLTGSNCEFCKLSSYQKDFIRRFIASRGNISEMVETGWGSREFIMDKLTELSSALTQSSSHSEPSGDIQILDDTIIAEIVNQIPVACFTTDPDFIRVLSGIYPEIADHYQASSPRNWKARIGRRLSQYATETNTITKSGRKNNSQKWLKIKLANNKRKYTVGS
jgi:hypothetical protein